MLAEGKTKLIRTADDRPGHVYLVAKDAITAHNGTRKGQMEGKGVIATTTCAAVFRYLEAVGKCRERLQVTWSMSERVILTLFGDVRNKHRCNIG